jgi:sortase A
MKMKFLNWTQRLFFILGLLLIGIYVAARLHREISSRAELRRFEDSRTETALEKTEALLPGPGFKVDFSLWDEKRIKQYENSLAQHFDPPLGVLRILKVHLVAPVLEGTDDLTLNRGVGHIMGTGRPGEDGNIGIAGHRDGFFRVLKDVRPGDTIELLTRQGTDKYVIDQIVLVRPDDVSVLQPRSSRSLTLVTCYPFYFIGSAPQRYIVKASLTASESAGANGVGVSRLRASAH